MKLHITIIVSTFLKNKTLGDLDMSAIKGFYKDIEISTVWHLTWRQSSDQEGTTQGWALGHLIKTHDKRHFTTSLEVVVISAYGTQSIGHPCRMQHEFDLLSQIQFCSRWIVSLNVMGRTKLIK